MTSTPYTVRAGTKDWQFRARKPEDAERVIALFHAIDVRYGNEELIGHALSVFRDARLNGAKQIIELTERRYGEHLARPSQEALAVVLARYGYGPDALGGLSISEQRQLDLAAAQTAFDEAHVSGNAEQAQASLYALKRAEAAMRDYT